MIQRAGLRSPLPTVGVEEEYQLVDPATGELIPGSNEVMRDLKAHRGKHGSRHADSDIQYELHLQQIEMASAVCESLDDVRTSLQQTRKMLIESAATTGAALAAAGTNPFPLPAATSVTPKHRYRTMSRQYQKIARDLLIFGCHVHVSMADRKLGVEVLNRSRRWLPVLQALSANSPYWDGQETGYASFRRELWAQMPMAGPPPDFEDAEDYEAHIADLIRCGAIKDESFIYWDIRLPTKVPTIEFRCADVMTRIEDVVGYVGLVRAIVMTSQQEAESGGSCPRVRQSVLSYAIWHAARYGMSERLIDPLTLEVLSAEVFAEHLIGHLAVALEKSGDSQAVREFIHRAVHEGTGAVQQVRAAKDRHDLQNVVLQTVAQTAAGCGCMPTGRLGC